MSLKINSSSLGVVNTAQLSFGAKSPASLVDLSKSELIKILGHDNKKELSKDLVQICRRMTGSEEPITKSVFKQCYDSLLNQCAPLKDIAKSLKKNAKKMQKTEIMSEEYLKTDKKINDLLLSQERPQILIKPIKTGAVVVKKAAKSIELSKNDILTLFSHKPNAPIEPALEEVCKRLTGSQNVTESVVQQCSDALTKENEALKSISENIQGCLAKTHNHQDIANNLIKNRKRLDAVVVSKDHPKYKVREIALDKEQLAQEAKLTAKKQADQLQLEELRREEKHLKQQKEKWVKKGQEQLAYVKAISEKNTNLPVFERAPRKERVKDLLNRRVETTNVFEKSARHKALNMLQQEFPAVQQPFVLPEVVSTPINDAAFKYVPKAEVTTAITPKFLN